MPEAAAVEATPLTLGVVVTNFNAWELTRRCLEKTLAFGDRLERILVVDDGSSAPPPPDLDGRIEVLRNPQNVGFGASLNRAFSHLHTDIVVAFDCDAFPLADFTPALRRAFTEDPALAAVGFRTVDVAGEPTPSSTPEPGLASLLLGQRLHRRYSRVRGDGDRGRLCLTAGALAVRKRAFDELGGFDERFDFLDLDVDFCMRVHRSAWRLAQMPELVACHEGGGTPQRTSERVLRFYRGRWLLLRKHGKVRYPALVRTLVLARLVIEYLALLLAGRLLFRRPGELEDKLAGRREVIRYCRQHYR